MVKAYYRESRTQCIVRAISINQIQRRLANIPPKQIVIGCFVVFFLIGMLIFDDYGIPIDEGTMDALGRDAYGYVFEEKEWPTNDDWRFHGPSVELTYFTVQKMFFSFDAQDGYKRILLRRFLNFLIFFGGAVVMYQLAKRHFGNWKWGLLCAGLLILSPRIFAHGFINSRDIPQLVFFMTGIFTLIRLLEVRTGKFAVVHGAVAALALSVRITAILLPVFTAVFLVLDLLWIERGHRMQHLKQNMKLGGIFLLSYIPFAILFWPFLWSQPLTHFIDAYNYMSSIVTAASNVEFLGTTYSGLPWHFIPVWIAITIPPVYLLFFLLGVLILPLLILHKITIWDNRTRNYALFLMWFFAPILAIMLSDSGIYTDWRHIYFIYPALALIAASALHWIMRVFATHVSSAVRSISTIAVLVVLIQMMITAGWMAWNHPFQNVYFSLVPKATIEKYFPLDYWGPSYKQSIAWLLENVANEHIIIYSEENIAFMNAYNTDPAAFGRIIRAPDKEKAQYILTRSADVAGDAKLIHEFTVDGMRINGIYKGPAFDTEYNVQTR